jgi:hypothetical protein
MSSSPGTYQLSKKSSVDQRRPTEFICLFSNKPYLLYPDYTVGTGITPVQLHHCRSRPITAGRELHPAPEDKLLLNL